MTARPRPRPGREGAAKSPGPTACLAALAAAGVLLAVPVPAGGREVRAVLDLAHAPAFGLLALAVLSGGRAWLPRSPTGAAVAAWGSVVVFGGVMEGVQALSGRHPSWPDAGANASGAAASLAWFASRGLRRGPRRAALAAAGVALLAVPSVAPLLTLADAGWQAWDGPRLASFERPTELSRWDFQDCRAAPSRRHATDGGRSLRLEIGPGPYPAATLTWPSRDWSGHAALTFDAYLDPGPPMDLVVKVEGRGMAPRYEDRFHRVVRLNPGPQRVRIALADVERVPSGRRLDLRQVGRLEFFAVDLRSPRVVYLDDLRLR